MSCNQSKTDAARQRPTRQSVGVNASVESDLTRELFDIAEIAAMRAALSSPDALGPLSLGRLSVFRSLMSDRCKLYVSLYTP